MVTLEGPDEGDCVMGVIRRKMFLGYVVVGWISASCYTIFAAAMKRLPWSVPILCVPILVFLTYTVYKAWPNIK